ncbi:uncharacterized protein LOC109594632 isoform X2 [Aethina tumida]|uniref:uncharacterized protein LOC109594632 isoform X2 n=1 Tax=Aethina tumida TaxID=116153 RepID=UPI00096B02CE|nr:uncharacterized protein LOC109594632 isoform X2 [Aethina tumida]
MDLLLMFLLLLNQIFNLETQDIIFHRFRKGLRCYRCFTIDGECRRNSMYVMLCNLPSTPVSTYDNVGFNLSAFQINLDFEALAGSRKPYEENVCVNLIMSYFEEEQHDVDVLPRILQFKDCVSEKIAKKISSRSKLIAKQIQAHYFFETCNVSFCNSFIKVKPKFYHLLFVAILRYC